MPLTADELAAELAQITYRPGWDLRFEVDSFEGPCLWVVAVVPDAHELGTRVVLKIRSLIPPMASTEAFDEWLLWRFCVIEIHEAREWFRRDGFPIKDPHVPVFPPPPLVEHAGDPYRGE